jgi:hypothetical protein
VGSSDYDREFARLQQETQDKADYARQLKSKEFMADLEHRRKNVGWKWSELYDQFMKDPASAIAEIGKREKRTSKFG